MSLFEQGLDALSKVSKLNAQVQILQFANEKWIQKVEIMSIKIKNLEVELQCLEEKKLEIHNQLREMEACKKQGTLNFSTQVFNKLTSVNSFGIFIPSSAKNIQLNLLKKE